MKKLLAILAGGLLATGAFAQATPATLAVLVFPAVVAAPDTAALAAAAPAPAAATKPAKLRNHHAKAPAKHKSAKVAKKTAKRSKTAA